MLRMVLPSWVKAHRRQRWRWWLKMRVGKQPEGSKPLEWRESPEEGPAVYAVVVRLIEQPWVCKHPGVRAAVDRERSEDCGDVETSGQRPGDWLGWLLRTLKVRETTGEDEPPEFGGEA
jgi:hypothetical protein